MPGIRTSISRQEFERRSKTFEEVGGGRKRLDRKAFRLEHGLERIADRVVVVHHDHGGLSDHDRRLPAA